MKQINIILLILITFLNFSCNSNYKKTKQNDLKYIFFLHNKFIENNPDGTYESKYGVKAEYSKILESFRKDGFIVISEKQNRKQIG